MDCTAVIDARLRAHLDTIAAIEKDETLKAAVQDAVDAIETAAARPTRSTWPPSSPAVSTSTVRSSRPTPCTATLPI